MSLRIQTDRWDITLEGEGRVSGWPGRAATHKPRLRVRTDNHDHLIQIKTDGIAQDARGRAYDGEGARLFEETEYRLTVVSRRGYRPRLGHLDPSLIARVRPIPHHNDVISGAINFRSQVGDSRFVVGDGESEVEISLEIRPTKLDYETDYEELLDEISGLARQLVLEFLRATTRGASTDFGNETRAIEWLLLLREEISSLERALDHITRNPYQQLLREISIVPAERVRRPSAATRRAATRGAGEGSWQNSTGIGRHRSRLPASQPVETLDNYENRWLRLQLERAIASLAQVRQQFEAIQRVRGGGKPNPRRAAIIEELTKMTETLSPFLGVSPFTDARPAVMHPSLSLALQRQPGYRDASQALLRLNMSLILEGEAVNAPVRDLSDLYEIWCFLAVVRSVSDALGTPVDVFDLVELRDSGIRLTVAPGTRTSARIKSDRCDAIISYNREYQMLSGYQRPDIVIEILRDDIPPVVLLLDAKYRLDTTPEYVRVCGCPGPPADAIGQLHRYRDAIMYKYPGYMRGRPVVRAIALFPLQEEDADPWVEHPFFLAIDEVGIGALPFLPSNRAWVDAWLRHGINAPPEQLAWPGPDFIAWREARPHPRCD